MKNPTSPTGYEKQTLTEWFALNKPKFPGYSPDTINSNGDQPTLDTLVDDNPVDSNGVSLDELEILGSLDSLSLYPSKRKVYLRDVDEQKEIKLSDIQYNILKYFMENTGKVLTYDDIIFNVEGFDEETEVNKLSFHVNKLSARIGGFIQNVYRKGYIFKFPDPESGDPEIVGGYVRLGELLFDEAGHNLYKGEERIPLSPIQFRLFGLLADNVNRTVSIYALLDESGTRSPASVRTHVSELRMRIGNNAQDQPYIINEHGRGYKLVV